MWKRKMIFAALATSSIGIMPVPASAEVGIYLDFAPPTPRYEVAPVPRVGHIWQPGVWVWRDGRHRWVPGHWVRERHGMYWHPDRWEEREGRWVFERGRWERERFAARHRDSDGDGVPDRFDRAPYNPYRQ